MTRSVEVPVLVVGGGPAGLTSALWLNQHGVDALLVERRDFGTHYPRAHLLNVRTMEVFHDLGLAEEVYALAAPGDSWRNVAWYTSLAGPTPLHGQKLGSISAWGGGDDAGRYAAASPRRFANLPQLHLDRILADRALKDYPERLLARHELVGVEEDERGVTAVVRALDSNEHLEVRCQYLVAADGGRTVGSLLGVEMLGPRALFDVASLYFSADLKEYADDNALLTYFVSPEEPASVPGALLSLTPAPMASDSPEWSLSVKFKIGDPRADDLEHVVARARAMLGISDQVGVKIHAVGRWQYEGVVADRFRSGRIFLVGDAAHRHPPTGGLGLNAAVQDAHNLAWKLTAVLRGDASVALLESYEQERQSVTAYNVRHALLNAGRHAPIGEALGLRPEQSADEGWQQVSAWLAATPAGQERRRAVANAIQAHADDYSQLNVEAGFHYRSSAVIPDGTPPPENHESPTDFRPTARPGHHLPHLWLAGDDGPVSPVDLVSLDRLTLVVSVADDDFWSAAAQQSGIDLAVLRIGGPDLQDPELAYRSLCGIAEGGALLVRPDKHVGWRVPTRPVGAAGVLTDAVLRILGRRSVVDTELEGLGILDQIREAGEVLRSGEGGSARTFGSSLA